MIAIPINYFNDRRRIPMAQVINTNKKYWEEGGGFFGRPYMEGDNSFEGYLSTPMDLSQRTSRELDGIVFLLDLKPGQSILDCPCGYGRHSIGLARRGFNVVGSDINGEMLAPALSNSAGINNVRFVKENMQYVTYSEEFDAVLNLFFSFGFFETDEENQSVLRNFYNVLRPGGKFMMHTDINVPRITGGTYKLHEKRNLKSGKQLEIVESYDPATKRLLGNWILHSPDGSKQILPQYNHRIYTFDDFAEDCRAIGFSEVEGYGDWDGSPLTDESEDMIIIAHKPAQTD
jgi:ubiquinone/menaquinone biosynthesis C-methylase UbiE